MRPGNGAPAVHLYAISHVDTHLVLDACQRRAALGRNGQDPTSIRATWGPDVAGASLIREHAGSRCQLLRVLKRVLRVAQVRAAGARTVAMPTSVVFASTRRCAPPMLRSVSPRGLTQHTRSSPQPKAPSQRRSRLNAVVTEANAGASSFL